jgi:uncharacterized protein (TIGR02246 family)
MNKTMKQLSTLAAIALMATSSSALAATLTADDYTAIQRLYAHYDTSIDKGDAEGWANTFTPDGVFANNFKGHDALVGFVNTWREKMNGTARRHFAADLVITPSDEGATGTVSALIIDLSTKPMSIGGFVTYSDVLVKTKDGWRFKNRSLQPVTAPAAATPPATSAPSQPGK